MTSDRPDASRSGAARRADTAAAHGGPRPPVGLVVAAILGSAWAALTALVVPLAAFGALPLSLGGMPVPPRVWMAAAAPLFVAAALVMAAFAAGVAARRAWTRPLPLLLGGIVASHGLVAGLAGAVPASLAWRATLAGAALAAVSFWYSYRRTSVVAYYASIRSRSAGPRAVTRAARDAREPPP